MTKPKKDSDYGLPTKDKLGRTGGQRFFMVSTSRVRRASLWTRASWTSWKFEKFLYIRTFPSLGYIGRILFIDAPLYLNRRPSSS